MSDFTALGKPVTEFEKLDRIETACKHIEYHSDQLLAVCPITGQPDFYEALIQLEADGQAIETKTLKLYLETFQHQGIFCEDLTVRICKDIFSVCNPYKCAVTLVQRRRGGIQITAKHEISRGE